MAFLSCATCVPSLSFAILVVAVCLCAPIPNAQGTVSLSPGRSTEFRPSSEKKSAVDSINTPRAITRNDEQPESMQVRRFMWKEVDETMDDIIQGVANGAVAMKTMMSSAFSDSPKIARFQRHAEHRPVPASNLKYVIKNPPPKVTRVIKVAPHIPQVTASIPKKVVRIIPANPLIHIEPAIKASTSTTATFVETSHPDENEFKIDEETLREIEKKVEEKAEATISSVLPNALHEEVIIGKLKSDWQPVILDTVNTSSFTTKKPHIVSHLHTNVLDTPVNTTQVKEESSYEVTENAAEETIQRPHTSRPDGEKLSRRKGIILAENKSGPDFYLKNHKLVDYSTTESTLPISKPKTSPERSYRKIKMKMVSTDHSTPKSSTPTSLKREVSTKPSTTRKPLHHRDKIETTKSENLIKQPEITKPGQLSNSRGSVKFGSKL